MRTPPLTSRWSEQLHIQLQGSLEILSLILGGNTLNTNESVTKEEEKDGRRWVAALPSLFLQRQALWSSSPHCLCGPQCKTQCKHTPSPLPTDSRAFHVPRGALDPLYTPARPTTPRPFQKHEAPSPPPAGPSFGLFPSQECPLHQAKPALLRSSQGSAPPSFVLSQNEFIPRVLRFPARLRRAGRWGRKTLCARHQGGFHLWAKSASHPGWALGGLEYPPSPPNAHLPRCQAPGRQDFG